MPCPRSAVAFLLACVALAAPAQARQAADDIPFAPATAGAVRTPSAPDAWGGPRTGQEATLSDQVVSYVIEARLDPGTHTIQARQRMTWRNRSDRAIGSVYLHLYLNAFSGEGSTFFTESRERDFTFRSEVPIGEGEWGYIRLDAVTQGGVEVPWRHVQPDGGPATDRTVARLDLPEPVPPGGELVLDIDFFDQLPRVVARTGWFGSFHLMAQWFPKIAVLELPGERGAETLRWNVHEFHMNSEFYADFGRFDVTLDVPSDVRVGATGTLAGEPHQADGRTRHRYVQDDVHDFAWAADANFAQPLTATWRGLDGHDVSVQVLYPPEYEKSAPPVLQATLDSLDYFSRTLGPYPYRSVTAVVPPYNAMEAGGMEYPTFFTALGFRDPAPDTWERAGLDFVTIHEFGHGYFQGILASNEFEEPWLDEGLNEFWNQRMLARRHPQGLRVMPRWIKALGIDPALDPFDYERIAAGLRMPHDGLGRSSWDRYSSGSYGTIYSRSAVMLRELEARVGSEALERAFRLYYERWKFRHPSTADLREALAEGTGQRELVEDMFERHVYDARKTGARIVRFASREARPLLGYAPDEAGRFAEITEATREAAIETARAQWKEKNPDADARHGGPFPYITTLLLRRDDTTPERYRVDFADGSQQTFDWNDERLWHRAVLTTPARATALTLDPDGVRHLDANRLDDARRVDPDPVASRRWSADAAALWNGLLALLVSL